MSPAYDERDGGASAALSSLRAVIPSFGKIR
jgi:hypothetical protein